MTMRCIIRTPGATAGGSQWTDLKTVAGYMRRLRRSPACSDCDVTIARDDWTPVYVAEFRGGHHTYGHHILGQGVTQRERGR